MAQKPNQNTASRAKFFIQKPFKKISIKPTLFSAFTKQQQLSSSIPQQDASFARQTSFSHRREPASLSPRQLASFSHRWPSSSTGQVIWDFSDECASSSSLQLSYSITQLSKSSTTRPSSLFFDQQQAAHSTKQFQTSSHNQFQPSSFQTPSRKPSVTMPGSGSLRIEDTSEFKKLPPVERANAFINHVVFDENKELSEGKEDLIKIKCDKTWTQLVELGNSPETLGTQQCQKLVQATVIGPEICHKLWRRLARIARKRDYTNEVTDYDAGRENFLVEGKAHAIAKQAKEREEKKEIKKKAKEEASGSTPPKEGSATSRMSKIFTRRKTGPEVEKKEGEGEAALDDEEPFWQTPESHTPKPSPLGKTPQDTPSNPRDLAFLEADAEALRAMLDPTPEEKEEMRRVAFADEAAAAKEGEASEKVDEAAVEGDKEDEADENAENKDKGKSIEVQEDSGSSRPKSPGKKILKALVHLRRKSTEDKEDSGPSRPGMSRSKSWAGRASTMGAKVSHGFGAGVPQNPKGPKDPKDPKDKHPRKKSV